jgi:hypothetical protein
MLQLGRYSPLTWPQAGEQTGSIIESHVAAVNGSLGFLLDNGIVPRFCAVMDAGEQLTNPSVRSALPQAADLRGSQGHSPASLISDVAKSSGLLDQRESVDFRPQLWVPQPGPQTDAMTAR